MLLQLQLWRLADAGSTEVPNDCVHGRQLAEASQKLLLRIDTNSNSAIQCSAISGDGLWVACGTEERIRLYKLSYHLVLLQSFAPCESSKV